MEQRPDKNRDRDRYKVKKLELLTLNIERDFASRFYKEIDAKFQHLFPHRLEELFLEHHNAAFHKCYLLNVPAGSLLTHNIHISHLIPTHTETLKGFSIPNNPEPKINYIHNGTTSITFPTQQTIAGFFKISSESVVEMVGPLSVLVHNPGGVFLFFNVLPISENMCGFDVRISMPVMQPPYQKVPSKDFLAKADIMARKGISALLTKPFANIADKSVAEDFPFFAGMSAHWRDYLITGTASSNDLKLALIREYKEQYGSYLNDLLCSSYEVAAKKQILLP